MISNVIGIFNACNLPNIFWCAIVWDSDIISGANNTAIQLGTNRNLYNLKINFYKRNYLSKIFFSKMITCKEIYM